jgi:peptidoglycan/LPS O-acetylase OafA/YrhL
MTAWHNQAVKRWPSRSEPLRVEVDRDSAARCVSLDVSRAGEILPLTALRGIAAWTVVAFHFVRDVIAWAPLKQVVAVGHLAVDVFFVLSGYVLARRYRDAPPDDLAGGRAFYVRRFARVYPLYLMSLVVGIVVGAPRTVTALATGAGVARIAGQLFLLNAWWHRAMFAHNWAAWSLSAEAVFYVLFPIVFRRVRRSSPRMLVSLLVVCSALTFVAPTVYTLLDPDHLGRPLAPGDEILWSWYLKFFPLQRIPAFVAGMAMAGLPGAPRGVWLAFSCAVALATLGMVVPEVYLRSGVLLPVVALLVASLDIDAARARWLTSRPAVALGRASYATYILHVPFFFVVLRCGAAAWEAPASVAIYIALLVPLSLAAYRYVEEPLRRRIVARFSRAGDRPPPLAV